MFQCTCAGNQASACTAYIVIPSTSMLSLLQSLYLPPSELATHKISSSYEIGTINRSISGPTQNQHQHQLHITNLCTPGSRRKGEKLTPTPIIPLKPNRITPLIQRHRQRTTHRRTPHRRHKRHHVPHPIHNHIRIPLRTIPIDIRNPNRARRRHRTRHIRERQSPAWWTADIPDVFGAGAAGAVEGFGAG